MDVTTKQSVYELCGHVIGHVIDRSSSQKTDHAPPGAVLVDLRYPGEQRGLHMGCGDRGPTESSVGKPHPHPQSQPGNITQACKDMAVVHACIHLVTLFEDLKLRILFQGSP